MGERGDDLKKIDGGDPQAVVNAAAEFATNDPEPAILRSFSPTSIASVGCGGRSRKRTLMPTDVLMPALSPTMEKGNLSKWLKKEGETIKSGDVIAEIETDKATMEVEATDEGTLGKILIPEGTADVAVNTPIARHPGDGECDARRKTAPHRRKTGQNLREAKIRAPEQKQRTRRIFPESGDKAPAALEVRRSQRNR